MTLARATENVCLRKLQQSILIVIVIYQTAGSTPGSSLTEDHHFVGKEWNDDISTERLNSQIQPSVSGSGLENRFA